MPLIDSNGISIHSHEELARFESHHMRDFPHTHVYDVSLLKRVCLDIKLPTIIRNIGWGKLYSKPRSGSHILTFEFLMTFETYELDGNLWVRFHLFGETYQFDFPHFCELMDFLETACLNPKP
jgi:hypothetical protein